MSRGKLLAWIQVVTVVAYVWYVYDATVGVPTAVEFNYGLSNACYRLASWFGRRGMKAERRYHELVESERTA